MMPSQVATAAQSELYAVKDLPVFQNRMFDSEAEARSCHRGDVVLVQDLDTGLVYNRAFDAERMRYDGAYQNEQAISTAFQRHLRDVVGVVTRHFSGHSLLEVGCGKGYFLEPLQANGFDITGMDPTYEGDNPAVVKEHFTMHSGRRAQGIVLRHVLEHIEDPVAFLGRIRDANGGAGKIYIEVPCFDWICAHKTWFDIFYEHVNYFRLVDFHGMFGRVDAAGRLFGDQYLYVVADLATLHVPRIAERIRFPPDFLRTVDMHASRLRRRTWPAAVWGGASKGVLFTLFMERAGTTVDTVVDANPAKQGKYIPATGHVVRSPEHAIRTFADETEILVMNSNYLNEIRQMTGGRFRYRTIDDAGV
jgi:SAM-dependent methyltransferase